MAARSRSRTAGALEYAGLVICRQRPSTANGVVFMTLEDETGFVNLILWRDVFRKFAAIARTASFVSARGKLQNQDGATHLVVDSLRHPRLDTAQEAPSAGSRDFH